MDALNGHATNLERKRLDAVAREYVAKGYRVIMDPGLDDLPVPLQRFRPDLVAYGSDENVVIEVKSRETLIGLEGLPRLAQVVETLPGWRLELVVVNPRPAVDRQPGVRPMDADEIARQIAAARQLLPRQYAGATLLAWSAAEATLRLLAQRERIRLERDEPSFIVKKLYVYGVLGNDDVAILDDAIRARNALIHGYQLSQPDESLIAQMLATIERLLHAVPETRGVR